MSNLSLVLMFSIWVILSTATPRILAVQYTVTMATTNTNALARFNKDVGAPYTQTIMAQSTKFIWDALDQFYDQYIKQVSLCITDIANKHVAAITTGNKINVSARPPTPCWHSYIVGFKGNLTTEFTGMVYSQMTRVWQQKGKGRAPEYILSGIDDFMRLKACYVTPDWPKPGGGNQWNESSKVTAMFLDYWDHVQNKFVVTLNENMKNGYNDGFLEDIAGISLENMWDNYVDNASIVLKHYCGHK